MRDRAVVAVTAAASGHIAWKLRETEADQLSAALGAASGSPGRLTLDRDDGLAPGWSCPCECATIEPLCNRRCAETGLAASVCVRTFDSGCAATCNCKR